MATVGVIHLGARRIAGSVLRPAFLCMLALLAGAIPAARAQDAPTRGYQVKAVFLYHFTQFVDWPAEAFVSPGSPIVIGILGRDPFGTFLDETVRNETIKGRPIVVRRYDVVSEVDGCHILFISSSERSRMGRTLSALEGDPVLTVADLADFTRDGGMVQFRTQEGKIRLKINVDASRAAGLAISSRLLSLAEIESRGGG